MIMNWSVHRSPTNDSVSRIFRQLGLGDFISRCPSKLTPLEDSFKVEITGDMEETKNSVSELEVTVGIADVLDYLEIKKEDLDDEDMEDDDMSNSFEPTVKAYPCEFCSYSSKTAQGLKQHKGTRHENIRFPCPFCSMGFKSKHGLEAHTKRKHSFEIFKCDRCDYTVKSHNQLLRHKRKHKTNPYTCEQCDFTSLSLGHLSRYRESHKTCNLAVSLLLILQGVFFS